MSTTKNDIRAWFLRGISSGATHMFVVCDTFDYEDYPVYVMPGEDVHERAKNYQGQNMQRLMEVYNISMDLEKQLNEHRSFNY
jgi:hypothetical protein